MKTKIIATVLLLLSFNASASETFSDTDGNKFNLVIRKPSIQSNNIAETFIEYQYLQVHSVTLRNNAKAAIGEKPFNKIINQWKFNCNNLTGYQISQAFYFNYDLAAKQNFYTEYSSGNYQGGESLGDVARRGLFYGRTVEEQLMIERQENQRLANMMELGRYRTIYATLENGLPNPVYISAKRICKK